MYFKSCSYECLVKADLCRDVDIVEDGCPWLGY